MDVRQLSQKIFLFFISGIVFCNLNACVGNSGNAGQLQRYYFSVTEAEWIRQGEPIEFEGDLWYPGDGVENFTDAEVSPIGDYKGVQFFIEKKDVRPYNRLYTKFGRNQFRYYEKHE
ncbi:MAG: hypothetical protein KC733_09580 [Candidatus Omnitrophica bacterium]|nr:hypothetical protein [Candidatus Omnitrophota bacterium]